MSYQYDNFLKFNTKFALMHRRRTDLHKPLGKTIKARLKQIFSVQKNRIVCNDYTVRFEKQ